MRSDDLVSVLEDLLEGMAVSDLRQGIDYKPGRELSDESWGILVRFLGGERPTAERPPAPVAPVGKTWDFDDDDEPVPARNPNEPLVLGGSFDGVELP